MVFNLELTKNNLTLKLKVLLTSGMKKKINHNNPTISDLPFYGFIAFVFIVFKLLYKYWGNDELLLLISPVSYLVSFFADSAVEYSSESGYFLPSLNIIINKSCSGFNFALITFIIFSFTIITKVKTAKNRIFLILLSFILAYILTIFSNTSRILSILKMNEIFPNWDDKYEWLHVTQGSFVNLFFLIGSYLLLNKWLESKYSIG